jgi:hypothetical protein
MSARRCPENARLRAVELVQREHPVFAELAQPAVVRQRRRVWSARRLSRRYRTGTGVALVLALLAVGVAIHLSLRAGIVLGALALFSALGARRQRTDARLLLEEWLCDDGDYDRALTLVWDELVGYVGWLLSIDEHAYAEKLVEEFHPGEAVERIYTAPISMPGARPGGASQG